LLAGAGEILRTNGPLTPALSPSEGERENARQRAGMGRLIQTDLLRAPFWLPKEWDLALHHRKAGLYLSLGYPLTLEEEFEFALPARAQPAVLPGVKENTTAPLRWRVEWTKLADDRLVVRMRAELAHGELTVAETPVVQRQLRELLTAIAAGASWPAAP
jgi:hypothetical protein